MCLDNVVNFPFPTPPSHSALSKAERLLTWLGALDANGRITDLGRLMSVFPVAPRFAKMLIVGQQHGCLPYVIAIVAGLSVGDPFVKEFNLDPDTTDGILEDLGANGFVDSAVARDVAQCMDSEDLAAKENLRAERKKYWSAQAKLSGTDPTSDILKWLTAIGAFEYSGGTDAVCTEYYVRPKAMSEIRKLRGQLTNLVQMYCAGVDVVMDPHMPPPSKLQQSVIRQIILAGFLDQVAVRADIAGFHSPDEEMAIKRRGIHATPYVTMWSDEPVFVHPESVAYVAARRSGSMPQAVVYSELQRTTRLWAKAVTIVNTKWLATIGQPLCTFGNPLPYPVPKYNESHDQMTCYVEPRFGPKSWELSMLEADAVLEGMSICQAFDLSASDLFIRWQAFVLNQHGGDASIKPTRERLLEVRSLMQLELERKSSQRRNGAPGSATKLPRLKERAHYDKSSVGALLQGLVSGSQRETMKTPQSANRVGLLKGDGALAPRGSPMFLPMTPSAFAEPSPSAIRYSKRKNMGYTEETLNPSLSSFKLPDIRKPLCIIEQDRLSVGSEAASGDESDDDAPRNKGSASTGSQSAAKRMRYMFEKTATRTETVNKRIERMAIDVKTKYNIETLANPTYPHQNTVTAVGRILNVNSEDGQAVTPMSSGSLYLETSRRLGNGRRIPLDVHSAPTFALFPGQI
ncbi:putative ATP-dependent RNA helicase DHR1, partial [Coemansia sp. RSA 1285]